MDFSVLNDPKSLLLAIPAVLLGLNEFLKKAGMPDRWCPVINLLFGGILGYFLFIEIGFSLFHALVAAFMIGLSAGGFYDLVKGSILGK